MVELTGAPLTHRRVLRLAVPIVLSNATVPILGTVDTGVVGQLGEAAPIGAVGIGGIVIAAVYWTFGFLRLGTCGLAAQAAGAEDEREIAALLVRALVAGACLGGLLIAAQKWIFWVFFSLSPASPEVESLARVYLQIRILGAPAAISLFGIFGWLIATERAGTLFAVQLWMNGLNMVLDVVFVLGLNWGVPGVAVASVIAEWSALALGLWMSRNVVATGYWNDWQRVFNRSRIMNMAIISRDIFLRTAMLQTCFLSFMFLGSSFDDETLAANQILIQFLFITAYALDGFAYAAESLVGQAVGAGDRKALRRSVVLTSFWGTVIVAVLVVGLVPFGNRLVAIMATSPEVRSVTAAYLPWMALLPFAGVGAWMLDGIFIGAMRTRDIRNMMAISFAAYLLAVLLLVGEFGNHGLWAALSIYFVARGVTLAARYPSLERST